MSHLSDVHRHIRTRELIAHLDDCHENEAWEEVTNILDEHDPYTQESKLKALHRSLHPRPLRAK